MMPYAPLGTLYAAAQLQAAGYSAALFDSIVVSTKWPMRWLLRNCRSGDTIPQAFDDLLPGLGLHALANQQQTQGSESG